ncbi:hypothetical protein Q6247_26050, partial [Klebsiella pneumoniae]
LKCQFLPSQQILGTTVTEPPHAHVHEGVRQHSKVEKSSQHSKQVCTWKKTETRAGNLNQA